MSTIRECDKFVSRLKPHARLLLATKALLAKTDMTDHQPNEEETFVWVLRPPHGVISASDTIYTDGSMVDGPTKEMGRVGYGFVATALSLPKRMALHPTGSTRCQGLRPGLSAKPYATLYLVRRFGPIACQWSTGSKLEKLLPRPAL